MPPDPIGFEGGINLYAYAFQSPLFYTDSKGLKCTLVNIYKWTKTDKNESDPDWGDWLYRGHTPTGGGSCRCSWRRESRIDIVITYTRMQAKIYKCTDRCPEKSYYKSEIKELGVLTYGDSRAGPRDPKTAFGGITTEGKGADVEGGAGCSCAPLARPAGIYGQ